MVLSILLKSPCQNKHFNLNSSLKFSSIRRTVLSYDTFDRSRFDKTVMSVLDVKRHTAIVLIYSPINISGYILMLECPSFNWKSRRLKACSQWSCFFFLLLKGIVSREFLLLVFPWISFPPAPEYSIRTVLNFFENSWRHSQVKVHHGYQRHQWQICHWCQWHRRQILPPVSLVLLLPVAICHRCQQYWRQSRCQRHRWQWDRWQIRNNIRLLWPWTWRQNCIYKLTLLPKGVQTK